MWESYGRRGVEVSACSTSAKIEFFFFFDISHRAFFVVEKYSTIGT